MIITVEHIIEPTDDLPKEVVIEDKEQLRLFAELDSEDRTMIFRMIDKMLNSKKFKEFFHKNVDSL